LPDSEARRKIVPTEIEQRPIRADEAARFVVRVADHHWDVRAIAARRLDRTGGA
jgi:hypothetical protein